MWSYAPLGAFYPDYCDIQIVIKSRLQAGHDSALRYKSSVDGILTVIKEEGISGLYKGVGSKLVQSVLTAAILFAGQKRIYEITRAVSLTPFAKSCCVLGLNWDFGFFAFRL